MKSGIRLSKTRGLLTAIVGALVIAMIQPVNAYPAGRSAGPTRMRDIVVGTDETGDWGGNPAVASVGAAFGQDLTKATIREEAGKVTFSFEVTELPAPHWTLSYYSWIFMLLGTTEENTTYHELYHVWPDEGEHAFELRRCVDNITNVGGGQIHQPECEVLAQAEVTIDEGLGRISLSVPRSSFPKEAKEIAPGAEITAFMPTAGSDVNGMGAWDSLTTDKSFSFKKPSRVRGRP